MESTERQLTIAEIELLLAGHTAAQPGKIRLRKSLRKENRPAIKAGACLAGNPPASFLGPFGEALVATGVIAESNPFRFSTKYQDAETGLLYYGYRSYQPQTGRWINRDPIEEDGGPNLYGYLTNDSINHVDPFGLQKLPFEGMVSVKLSDDYAMTVSAPFGFTVNADCNKGKLVADSPTFIIPQHLSKDWSADITDLGKISKKIAEKMSGFENVLEMGPQAKLAGQQSMVAIPVIAQKSMPNHKRGCCWTIHYDVWIDVSAHLQLYYWKASFLGMGKTQKQAYLKHYEKGGGRKTQSYQFCCLK